MAPWPIPGAVPKELSGDPYSPSDHHTTFFFFLSIFLSFFSFFFLSFFLSSFTLRSHVFKGDDWHIPHLKTKTNENFNVGFFVDTIKVRSFKFCVIITCLGLHCHCIQRHGCLQAYDRTNFYLSAALSRPRPSLLPYVSAPASTSPETMLRAYPGENFQHSVAVFDCV